VNTQRAVLVLLAVAAAGNWSPPACAEAPPSSEEEKRLKILAGYHSWSPEERREAVQALTRPEYRGKQEIGRALFEVAWFNKDPEARLAAFQALCTWKDEDGSLAYHLSRLFKHELEPTNKPGMAQAMTRLAFKTDVLNELIFYIRLLGGTDDYGWGGDANMAGGGAGGGAGKPNSAWFRAHYKAILDAINKISGKHFVASHDTGRQLLNWWRLNAMDFQQADYGLIHKPKGAQAVVAQAQNPGAKQGFDRLEEWLRSVEAPQKPQPKPAGLPAKEDEIE
jgi:hypothetical protein